MSTLLFSSPSKLLLLLSIPFWAMLAACEKDSETTAEVLTPSEAAELTESALSGNTGGMAAASTDMLVQLETSGICGYTKDTTLQRSGMVGQTTYSLTSQLTWQLICSQFGVPQSANATSASNGSFVGPKWTGNGTGSGTYAIAGLNPVQKEYVLNGSYQQTSAVNGKVRNLEPGLDCVLNASLVDVKVTKNKENRDFVSGTGNVQITATTKSGKSKTLTGTFTINMNVVTLVVNGYTYTFEL